MSYTYSSLLNAVALQVEVDPADANFLAAFPQLVDDAEQRIYRELDLLTSIVTANGTATANSRTFTLPTSGGSGTIHFLVVDAVNVIDASGTRHTVRPATREGIDFLYPAETAPTAPCYPKEFCRADDTTLRYGPAPDFAYTVEVIGTIRPAPLSATNTSTYLSNYLSDLLFAGVMVAATGYQKNWSAQADDPKMAISWEDQFQKRLASARQEEMRKSYVSQMSAPPISQRDA